MSTESDILDLQRRLAALETLPGGEQTGSFTPAFTGSGTAGVFTYGGGTVGTYVRRGTLVYVAGRAIISAIGTPPTGNMSITGLPFTSVATYNQPLLLGYVSNINYAASAVEILGLILASTTAINVYEAFDNSGAVQMPAANFTNVSADIIFGGVYKCV